MRVLLLGATGLIGAAALARLASDGAQVVGVARRRGVELRNVRWLELDLSRLTAEADWSPHLDGVEAVVNCAGALQDGRIDDLRGVHVDGIAALYRACERAGVTRVVHVSAIGADRPAQTPFAATKQAGDQALRQCDLDWVILRPSVVVGRSAYGGSALLRGLAGLPVLPELPDTGHLQIVQLDDLVESIVFFLRAEAPARLALDVAGPERLTLTDVVLAYRRWLRLRDPRRVRIPAWLAAVCYRLGDGVRALGWRSPIGSTVRAELARGAIGDPQPWSDVTGIAPQSLAAAFAREPASVQERWFARLYFVKPLLLTVLVAFWISTGVIALGPGAQDSLEHLRASGADESIARAGVIAGALADIAIGVGIALQRTARGALYAALGLSALYLLAGTLIAPELWLDPLGPLLKILPIAALHVAALAILTDR